MVGREQFFYDRTVETRPRVTATLTETIDFFLMLEIWKVRGVFRINP